MGKPALKNKFSTPNPSGPPKGISVCSHKISKSTPRHPPKPTTMQYFRDAAAALVSSQGSKSRLNLSGKSTPLKNVVVVSKAGLDKSKGSSKPSPAPSTTHRISRSLAKSVNKDRSGVNEHDTTYTVDDLSVSQTVKTRSGVGQGQLKRTGTYVVRTSEKKVKSPPLKESPKNKEQVADRVQKTNPASLTSMEVSQSALRTSRSHSSSLDKLVDPIMDCVSALEKHHQECLNAIFKSTVTNTLISRKIRPSSDNNGSNDSQAAEVDAMIKELSEEYESRIEKLLSIKRHKLKEFMIVQLRKRQVKLQE